MGALLIFVKSPIFIVQQYESIQEDGPFRRRWKRNQSGKPSFCSRSTWWADVQGWHSRFCILIPSTCAWAEVFPWLCYLLSHPGPREGDYFGKPDPITQALRAQSFLCLVGERNQEESQGCGSERTCCTFAVRRWEGPQRKVAARSRGHPLLTARIGFSQQANCAWEQILSYIFQKRSRPGHILLSVCETQSVEPSWANKKFCFMLLSLWQFITVAMESQYVLLRV